MVSTNNELTWTLWKYSAFLSTAVSCRSTTASEDTEVDAVAEAAALGVLSILFSLLLSFTGLLLLEDTGADIGLSMLSIKVGLVSLPDAFSACFC